MNGRYARRLARIQGKVTDTSKLVISGADLILKVPKMTASIDMCLF